MASHALAAGFKPSTWICLVPARRSLASDGSRRSPDTSRSGCSGTMQSISGSITPLAGSSEPGAGSAISPASAASSAASSPEGVSSAPITPASVSALPVAGVCVFAEKPGSRRGSTRLISSRSPPRAGSARSVQPSPRGVSSTGGLYASGPRALRICHWLYTTITSTNTTPAPSRAITRLLSCIYAASAMVSAASISTATIRDTPCSCMVTPMSCCAISIAILL